MNTHNFSRSQTIRKPVTASKGGVVAAQHFKAAQIGADILDAGGNAVDAAIAVSYAIGVLEPWMSGPAGGGAMIIWDAAKGRSHAITYGMRSPKGLDISAYPLDDTGRSVDLFPWKCVTGDRNVKGPHAIAVPGTVAGTELAHSRFGTMPWADLLSPAIAEAKQGMLIDWYAALIIASGMRQLAEDTDAAAMFLEDGHWPPISGWTALAEKRLDQSKVADTLSRLAKAGARDFYEGDIACELVKDLQAKGSTIAMEDLQTYAARHEDSLQITYRDAVVHAVPKLTAGPTLSHVLELLQASETPGTSPDAGTYRAYAKALAEAYAHRLAEDGDQDAPHAPSCTTHFSVVDKDGNMVAMTQTLLSLFGSSVVSPTTGLLMNNGIMWFDPEQGHPNSLGPNKACLMNVCPVIFNKGNRRGALGASGGRKIMPAVAQLTSFMTDFDMSLEEAFHHPRIDMSGGEVLVADENLPADVLRGLHESYTVVETKRTSFPYAFACPAAVMREGELNAGCTEIMSPWGDAVAQSGAGDA